VLVVVGVKVWVSVLWVSLFFSCRDKVCGGGGGGWGRGGGGGAGGGGMRRGGERGNNKTGGVEEGKSGRHEKALI